MKESTIIIELQRMWKGLHSIAEGLKIAVLSQSVRDRAVENLLIAKGLFTKEELEAELQKEAKALMAEAEKVAASQSNLVAPAPESKIILPDSVQVPPNLIKPA